MRFTRKQTMSHELTIAVSDSAIATLEEEAKDTGVPMQSLAAQTLERATNMLRLRRQHFKNLDPAAVQAAVKRFESHFGSIRSGDPQANDTERIDADLAREYGDNHETL
jgi:hypothetical protein